MHHVLTFSLLVLAKVIDGKGQSAEDEVNVYVKPPINLPPTAHAGENQEISLPQNWVVLDGESRISVLERTQINRRVSQSLQVEVVRTM